MFQRQINEQNWIKEFVLLASQRRSEFRPQGPSRTHSPFGDASSLSSGSNRYRILPLHSQIPREEQRRVFEPVPENITKVRPSNTGRADEEDRFYWVH